MKRESAVRIVLDLVVMLFLAGLFGAFFYFRSQSRAETGARPHLVGEQHLKVYEFYDCEHGARCYMGDNSISCVRSDEGGCP